MSALLARRGAAPGGPAGADRVRLLTVAAGVVAGLGLIGAVVFGILLWNITRGAGAQAAVARDDALASARQVAANLQTLDYNTVDEGLDTWQASATGPLLGEFTKNRQQYAAQIRQARTSTTARVVDAALSDFDDTTGKATAIAAVDVSTTQQVNGAPSLPVTKQVRIQLELVRMPDAGWKADAASAL
ncbi:MAG TPA: hypothetical protein VGM60_10255 [Pseudonocardia sp.]|jgi:Mce-associated membrane protein|uniref:hypothetical protein n=1 Tax=Pseudonocardia sp. TaxID=60912 RepID=UPI002F409BF5